MSLDPDVLAAYHKTDYIVSGKPDIVMRIGEKNPRLDYLLDWLGRDTAAWLTAFNPGGRIRDAGENERAMQVLKNALQIEPGVTLVPGEARDPEGKWPVEPSLLAVGMRRAEAEALGRRLGQNAIVYVEKGRAPELIALS